MQEIAIRVRIQEQEQLGLAEYERIVGSVATVAALIAWLPSTDERLVLRGRGTEPARVETVTHGTDFEMLVVLDQRALATERAAGAVAALIEAARGEDVEAAQGGVAGEIDRLDRLAPRGRTVAERALRTFLEQAKADVVERRATSKVRAASALVRLAEEGAELHVERVEDVTADEVATTPVEDALPESGSTVVIPETPVEKAAASVGAESEDARPDGEKTDGEESDAQKSEKKDEKKSAKQSEKKDEKQSDKKKADKKKSDKKKSAKKAEKKSAKKDDKKAKKSDGKKAKKS